VITTDPTKKVYLPIFEKKIYYIKNKAMSILQLNTPFSHILSIFFASRVRLVTNEQDKNTCPSLCVCVSVRSPMSAHEGIYLSLPPSLL